MKAAGDVGRGDDVEQRRVLSHHPGAEGLAHIRVQIYVLHVFQKKTQKTPARDIAKGRQRLKLIR